MNAHSSDAYLRMLKHLMPPGVLHNLEPGSDISRSLDAIAQELARVGARGAQLIEESDPRTADETIEDWERVLGIPDEQVTELGVTLAERRVAITQKLVAQGGQSEEYFFALASACGWPLDEIRLTEITRVGARVGDRIYGEAYVYSMNLFVSLGAGTGDGALSQAAFERVIRHATHAHITVEFTYL